MTEHSVLNPAGKPGIYGTVHFKNLAIGIVPLDADGNTWLVRQYRFPLREDSWEIPEGGGAMDVDPLVSAQRELLEETGIRARDWQLIRKTHLSNSVSDEVGFIFVAEGLEFGEARPEETEQLLVEKVSLRKAWEMVERGEITDSISVMGLMEVRWGVGRRFFE